MKKVVSLISTVWMLLCLLPVSASADLIIRPPIPQESTSVLPFLLIGLAIVVIGVVIWRLRRKKQ